MNGSIIVHGVFTDALKCLSDGLIANRRRICESASRDSRLSYDICNAEICVNFDELDISQHEGNAFVVPCGPFTISTFGRRPSLGKSFYEAGVPVAQVITTVNDDAAALASWCGGVAFDVIDRHTLYLHRCIGWNAVSAKCGR